MPATTSPSSASPSVDPSLGGDPFTEEQVVLDVAVKEPSTLDPMRIQDPGSYLVARQIYEGLTAWDTGLERAVPAVAASWRAAAGGRLWTFELLPGLTFHDGTPVRASDFVFAFDRIAKKSNASELAFLLEDVTGFEEVNRTGTADHLAGLSAPSDTTLTIGLDEPNHDLPALLTHPALVPVPRRAVADIDAFLSSPVGNGPFEIAAPWAPGRPVLMRAFLGYPDTPEIDGLRFHPFTESASSWIPFVRGELDIAEVPVGQFVAAGETFGERGFEPLLSAYLYGFDLRAPALRDRRVRLAVNRAIDREAIATEVFKGTMEPARGIVPQGMPGFDANVCLGICDHDPQAAARIVARLPRAARDLRLDFTAGVQHAQVAAAVETDLEAVGFRVETRSFPFPRYLRRLQRGTGGVYRLGWIAEYPSADVFLRSLFGSDSPDNHSGFSSRRVDALLRAARGEPSDDVRASLYARVEEIVLRALPVVPLGSFLAHWAAQPEVAGFEIDPMGGFDAVRLSVAPEAPR